MQLKNYLHLNNISASDFALNIGVCRATISRWIGGSRFPSKKLMLKIYTNTNGLVKVDDFYHIKENNQLQLINDIKAVQNKINQLEKIIIGLKKKL